MTDTGPAANWSELLAQNPPRTAFTPVAYYVNVLQTEETANALVAGTPLRRASDSLVCGAIVDPGRFAQTAADKLAPYALRVLDPDSTAFDDLVAHNLGALTLADLSEAAGWDLGLAGEAPLDRLLAGPAADRDVARQVAWAALARGRSRELEPFILKDPAAAPPDPGAQFKGGAQPIQVHLARCLIHGGDPRTPWAVYRDQFPVNLAIEQATWSELLWAARTVHVELGGAEPGSLLSWLRAEVGAA